METLPSDSEPGDSDDHSDHPNRNLTPKKKKLKRYATYSDKWNEDLNFKSWIRKKSSYDALCLLCGTTISVKYEGVRALHSHAASSKHKSAELARRQSKVLQNFFSKPNSNNELKIIKREVASVYHNVTHGNSYASLDCLHRMLPKLFSDSKLAQSIVGGWTKSTAIAQNVLGPEAEKRLRLSLQRSFYFGIASDASNKGNIKMYPYAVQYFDRKLGVTYGLLDFYEDPKEKSIDIYDQIIKITEKNGLKLKQVSSYSADNANVNYGQHNSVYQKLRDQNASIISANCKCHVLHNAIKNASLCFSFDVQALVLSVYAEFSSSAANCETLKEFCEMVEMEYYRILRHVPTRWLTLLTALERILSSWPALKAYFLSQGREDCVATIWNFVATDENDSSVEGLPECYMYFLHNIMQVFQSTLLKLQAEDCTATEIFEIMSSLQKRIQNRRDDQFYGSKTQALLKTLKKSEVAKFQKEVNTFFSKLIDQGFKNGTFL